MEINKTTWLNHKLSVFKFEKNKFKTEKLVGNATEYSDLKIREDIKEILDSHKNEPLYNFFPTKYDSYNNNELIGLFALFAFGSTAFGLLHYNYHAGDYITEKGDLKNVADDYPFRGDFEKGQSIIDYPFLPGISHEFRSPHFDLILSSKWLAGGLPGYNLFVSPCYKWAKYLNDGKYLVKTQIGFSYESYSIGVSEKKDGSLGTIYGGTYGLWSIPFKGRFEIKGTFFNLNGNINLNENKLQNIYENAKKLDAELTPVLSKNVKPEYVVHDRQAYSIPVINNSMIEANLGTTFGNNAKLLFQPAIGAKLIFPLFKKTGVNPLFKFNLIFLEEKYVEKCRLFSSLEYESKRKNLRIYYGFSGKFNFFSKKITQTGYQANINNRTAKYFLNKDIE